MYADHHLKALEDRVRRCEALHMIETTSIVTCTDSILALVANLSYKNTVRYKSGSSSDSKNSKSSRSWDRCYHKFNVFKSCICKR